jgi:large subunit ribosomal protein L4
MKLNIYNNKGQETGTTLELNDAVFAIEPNDHAIYLDCKAYLAGQRQGTSKSKERGEITGSTRKIKRQKGTGTARAGSIKSPLFRGGGRVFGPRPRDYSQKVNKKVKQLARLSALTYKAKEQGIIVLDSFGINDVKTKSMVEMQKNFNISNKKVLIVVNERNNNVYLSSRNLLGVDVVSVSSLNTYQILRASTLMFEADSIEVLNQASA